MCWVGEEILRGRLGAWESRICSGSNGCSTLKVEGNCFTLKVDETCNNRLDVEDFIGCHWPEGGWGTSWGLLHVSGWKGGGLSPSSYNTCIIWTRNILLHV